MKNASGSSLKTNLQQILTKRKALILRQLQARDASDTPAVRISGRARRWVFLIWACFVVRGLFYASAIPLWEGFDEYAHYARIEYLALEGREPSRTTLLPADVQETFSHAPVRNGGMTIDAYWKLTPEERRRGFPAPQGTIYEAQQPPLFYWMLVPIYRSLGGSSLETRVLWIRAACVLLASIFIPLGFLIARSVCGRDREALGATALMAALPLLTFTSTHIANEALAIPLGTLIVLLTLRLRPISLSATLGAALLTKAYFLLFLPPVALLLLSRKTRRSAAIALSAAIVIAGWWYWHAWTSSGSLTGNILLVQPSSSGAWRTLGAFRWGQASHFAWMTFVWVGNWSFLVVRSWMYQVLALVCLLALCGAACLAWKRDRGILLCGAFLICFASGVLYYGLVAQALTGFPSAAAWYACCLAAPFSILMCAGLRTIAPRSIEAATGPLLVIMFSALEFFGANLLLLPYYAGFTSHLPNGGLPAGKLAQLVTGGPTLAERLTFYKPPWLTSSVLIWLWGLSLLATAALVVISVWLGLRPGENTARVGAIR